MNRKKYSFKNHKFVFGKFLKKYFLKNQRFLFKKSLRNYIKISLIFLGNLWRLFKNIPLRSIFGWRSLKILFFPRKRFSLEVPGKKRKRSSMDRKQEEVLVGSKTFVGVLFRQKSSIVKKYIIGFWRGSP